MREIRTHILTSVLLIGGAIILFFAQFSPWVSQIYSPWDLFQWSGIGLNGVIYIFPIISSITVMIISVLLLIRENINKGFISLILFIALSLLILFLLQMFSESGNALYSSTGFYLGITGFGIIFFGLFYMLIQESPESNLSESKK